MIRSLVVALVLAVPALAHAQAEESPQRSGFVGFGAGWFQSTLDVTGFTDPSVSGGKIEHACAGIAPVITVGHRARWVRVYGDVMVSATDPRTEKGASSVETGFDVVSIAVEGTLPIGPSGHAFAGLGFGAANYEMTVEEPGTKTVLDHTDLVNTFQGGYFHDLGRVSVEGGLRYVMNDEKQASGRYTVQSTSMLGGYVGVRYAF